MPRDPHPLASLAQVVESPSVAGGVPHELEMDLRVAGCALVQDAGVMLQLPQSTMATAQVIFHRFYYVSSMLSFGVCDLSVSALYLATKLNETPVRLRDLINTYIFLQARIQHLLSLPPDRPLCPRTAPTSLRPGVAQAAESSQNGARAGAEDDVWAGFRFDVPSFHSTVFWDWKEAIQYNELQILKRLGFNMQVDLPYSLMINYLKILDLVFEEGVAQMCWSILNDALLTPLYTQYPTHVLAVAAIYLCTSLRRIPLPAGWCALFDAADDDVRVCAGAVVALWTEWGAGDIPGALEAGGADGGAGGAERAADKEKRWRRAWVLMQDRKAVRRWVDGRAGGRGGDGDGAPRSRGGTRSR